MMNCIVTAWDWITDHATVISAVVSASAALAVARYTQRLTIATTEQAQLTRDALNLARDEFIATHRPILKVRSMEQLLPIEGANYDGAINVSNVGVSPARIIEIRTDTGRRHYDTQWKTKGAWFSPKPHIAANELPEDKIIPAGTSKPFRVKGQSPIDGIAMAAAEMDRSYPALCLIGEVVYADASNIRRRIGFVFYWNAMGGQWQRPEVPDEEFEYED